MQLPNCKFLRSDWPNWTGKFMTAMDVIPRYDVNSRIQGVAPHLDGLAKAGLVGQNPVQTTVV